MNFKISLSKFLSKSLSKTSRKLSHLSLTTGLLLSLSGCGMLHPYKIPVQQGRIITDQQIASLSPGMTEEQVQFILGTPGTKDPFETSSWYYIYTHKEKNYPMTEKQLILVFKDHKLIQINGNYAMPAPSHASDTTNLPQTAQTPTPLISSGS
jgi:outer membrane protein assembly factor BamE